MERIGIKYLGFAVLVVALLNVGLLTQPFISQNWDSEMHLFFASHYLQHWDSGWENKWYGGFSVYVSAPLAHLLIALMGNFVSLEAGYLILQAAALTLFPVSVFVFVREVLDEQSAGIASLLSTGVAGAYVVLYTFGQLPFFLAACFGLLAAAAYVKFLRNGGLTAFFSWTFLAGTAIATHHHSSLVILPLFIATTTLMQWFQGFKLRSLFRVSVAMISFAFVAVLVILPFWWWFLSESLPQNEIYHPSRDAYFRVSSSARMFFWDMYGGVILLIPLVMLGLRYIRLLPLIAMAGFLVILGLGGNTIVPQKLLGSISETLTFERFSFWAAVLIIIPAAFILKNFKGRMRFITMTFIAITMLVGIVRAISFPHQQELLQKPLTSWEEREVVRFLNDHDEYNYLTLGLGEPQMVRISRLTNAWTVDGFYHQARSKQELRDSLIGTIDASEWEGEKSYDVLFSVLQYPAHWQVRYVVSGSAWSEGHLKNSGWEILHPIGSRLGWQQGERHYSNITVWEAPQQHLSEIKPRHVTHHPGRLIERIFLPFLWVHVPLLFLVFSCLFSFILWRIDNG
ncbi:MAG: hypothetical protein WDZ94_03105 [Patescibacteria group bacterium]